MKWLAIIGLVFNVAGAVFFIIDTNRLSALLSSMVKHMADGYGFWDQKPFEKEQLSKLTNGISSSKKLTRWGYTLFFGGFLLQLIAAVFSTSS